MEQLRVFIAIALSFLVFFAWSAFFPGQKGVPVAVDPKVQEQKPEKKEEAVETYVLEEPEIKDEEIVNPLQQKGRIITVETDLLKIGLDTRSGTISSVKLKKYKEKADQKRLQELFPQEEGGNLFAGKVLLANNSIPGFNDAVYSSSAPQDSLDATNEEREIVLYAQSKDGVRIEKVFTFTPGSYVVPLMVIVKNGSQKIYEDRIGLAVKRHLPEDNGQYGFKGASLLLGKDMEKIKPKEIAKKGRFEGDLKWAAIEDRYFLSAIIPHSEGEKSLLINQPEKGTVECRLFEKNTTFIPERVKRFSYHIYFGPKSIKVLSNVEKDLKKVVDFGMFDIIAKPCLLFMNWIYDHVVSNYGIAIIILTIITKILLWPLGTKSYKSMNDMKKLQPIMAEIREKYKHDKKRMNQEMMALYKTYKVNPMGGCLPMLLQIPVFIALYRMLYEAIELRHAPFFLWINDLSAPDRLFSFDFSIPFMQPPYGIPVLTIVMGATMFLQQKMSPPPGDPTQAKMMLFMPIIFTFIFINFSSGLVLYWLVNNLASIAQQYYISKKSS